MDVSSLVVSRRAESSQGSAAARRMVWRDRVGRGSWSGMDLGYILSLFVLVVLNLFDITITLFHTGNVGWEAEGNMLIRVIAQSYGEIVVVLFKLVLVGAALGIMWYVYRRTRHAMALARTRSQYNQALTVQWVVSLGTLALVFFYVLVISNNVFVVWG